MKRAVCLWDAPFQRACSQKSLGFSDIVLKNVAIKSYDPVL